MVRWSEKKKREKKEEESGGGPIINEFLDGPSRFKKSTWKTNHVS